MISIIKNEFNRMDSNGDPLGYVELACTSTDTKPTTGIVTGSKALEVDTGKTYAFDEESGDWEEQTSGGGGGGGGSDFSTAKLTLINTLGSQYTDNDFYACVLEEYDEDQLEPIPYSEMWLDANQTLELNVILYKGNAHIGMTKNHVDYTTGAIEWDSDYGSYHLTGNATVRFR